jgi:hypothetical protein
MFGKNNRSVMAGVSDIPTAAETPDSYDEY